MPPCLLNIDLGELPDEPEELYALAHIANIACGGHAGDDASMSIALTHCARYGTRAGAHPSYPDRKHFGRQSLPIPPESLRALVAEQCERLADHASRLGLSLGYVKPHGALYHVCHQDFATARAVVAGAVEALGYQILFIGPPSGALAEAAHRAGIGYAREGFADRRTRPDGTLIPRSEPDALITDPHQAAEQALQLARTSTVDTICVHGDTPSAVAIARAVRAALDAIHTNTNTQP